MAVAGPTLEHVAGLGLGLRDTVILVQAAIEYHVNRMMLKRFGTDSFESERMSSKVMSLNDVGVIDDRLRQDLIQIARIRHLFAHETEVEEGKFLGLLGGINRKGGVGSGGLRGRFLDAAGQSLKMVRQRQEDMQDGHF